MERKAMANTYDEGRALLDWLCVKITHLGRAGCG